jgi:hypothetical protein
MDNSNKNKVRSVYPSAILLRDTHVYTTIAMANKNVYSIAIVKLPNKKNQVKVIRNILNLDFFNSHLTGLSFDFIGKWESSPQKAWKSAWNLTCDNIKNKLIN